MEQGDVATVRGLEGSTETGRQRPGRPGPVAPRRHEPRAAAAAWRSTTWRSIPRACSARWQRVNRDVTLPHCIAHVERARQPRQPAPRHAAPRTATSAGCRFADSDVYKMLEAAGWELARGRAARAGRLRRRDHALLADVQEDDGYLNSYYQGVHPDRKLREFHWGHEMYCAGHLLQAAVAVARSDRSRRPARRSRRAWPTCSCGASAGRARRRSTATPRSRPRSSSSTASPTRPPTWSSPRASSSCAATACSDPTASGPTTSRTTRPCARPPSRPATPSASSTSRPASPTSTSRAPTTRCWPRWRSCGRTCIATKTYVTGAHGSRHRDEAFGDPYELPPDRAYAETCAAVASFQWNWRMLLATGRGRYADEMERVLYNAVAAGTSLDGRPLLLLQPAAAARRPRRRRRGPPVRAPGVVPLPVLPAEPRAPRRLAERLRRHERRRRRCSCTC